MAADFKEEKVLINGSSYQLPSHEVFPITSEEVLGAGYGQRPDLLMFPERSYYNADTGLVYKVDGGALVTVTADAPTGLPSPVNNGFFLREDGVGGSNWVANPGNVSWTIEADYGGTALRQWALFTGGLQGLTHTFWLDYSGDVAGAKKIWLGTEYADADYTFMIQDIGAATSLSFQSGQSTLPRTLKINGSFGTSDVTAVAAQASGVNQTTVEVNVATVAKGDWIRIRGHWGKWWVTGHSAAAGTFSFTV